MASMKCPTCGAGVNRLVWLPTLRGDDPVICCGNCRHTVGDNRTRDRALYTGRRIWPEEKVYSRDKLKEKNFEFEQRTKKEVADNWKNMRKSTRMRLFGE